MSQSVKKLLFVLSLTLTLSLPPLRRSLWALTLSLTLAWALRTCTVALSRRGVPRRWAAGAVALILGALSALTLWGSILAVFGLLDRAAGLLPDTASFFALLRRLAAQLPDGLGAVASQGVELLEQRGNLLREQLVLRSARLSARLLSQLPHLLFFLVVVGLSAFYAAVDWDTLRPCLLRAVPEDWRSPLGRGLRLLRQGLRRWAAVQGRLLLFQYLLLTAGLLLLGQRCAGGVAALAALSDALPLLGTGAVLLPLSALRLLAGQGKIALGLLVLTACCWTLRTVLEPRLVGAQAGWSPFFTLLALYLGAECFGFPGVLAALVLACALGGVSTGEGRRTGPKRETLTRSVRQFKNFSCIFPPVRVQYRCKEGKEVRGMSERRDNPEGGEEFSPTFITLTSEDGEELELEYLDTLEYNDQVYMAFFPTVPEGVDPQTLEDSEEYGLIILKVINVDGEEQLSTLDSEEEAEEVYQRFMEELLEDEE